MVDYRSEQSALQPVHERRELLMAEKGLLCECPRCSAYGDDTRSFPCAVAQCGGRQLAHQPTSADAAQLTPCSACGAVLPPPRAAALLKAESALAAEVARINHIINSGLALPGSFWGMLCAAPHS